MTNKYLILTDACCDLSRADLEKNGILVVPMEFSLGKEVFLTAPNKDQLPISVFYDKIRKGERGGSSHITTSSYINFLRPYLEDGNDIILVTVSSALSSNFSHAFSAVNALINEYPERTIKVLDCLNIGSGMDLILTYMADNKAKGLSIMDNYLDVYDKIAFVHTWVSIKDYKNINHRALLSLPHDFLMKSFKMRPILHIDNCGNMALANSAKTSKVAMDLLFNHVQATIIEPTKQTIFITCDINTTDALALKTRLTSELKVKEVKILSSSPIICLNSGLNTLTISYLGKMRKIKRPI